jgi:diacylglycerol kinase (ATP)
VEASASIDDGHLDLYSMELREVWKLALMLPKFLVGRHGAWAEVRTARCVEFDIVTERPMAVSTDGELLTETPAHFAVHPAAVSVFVPAP